MNFRDSNGSTEKCMEKRNSNSTLLGSKKYKCNFMRISLQLYSTFKKQVLNQFKLIHISTAIREPNYENAAENIKRQN